VNIAGKNCRTPITVKSNEHTRVDMKCFGTLWVEAEKDFMKFVVKDKNGVKIATGDTRITNSILPVGEYMVHCNGKIKELTITGGDRHTLNF
jgi:uncharacterized Zn ribbon protein